MPTSSTVSSHAGDLQKRLDLVDEEAFAALRGAKKSALRNERSLGKGPEFIRVGRRVFYKFDAVMKFLESRTVRPTATPSLIHGARKHKGTTS